MPICKQKETIPTAVPPNAKRQRLVYIDYLKVLGLFLVILAHVDCPDILHQIRSFDVPLLVFVSGYLASKTFRAGNDLQYYWKRIKRLAVPSWLFLIVFFLYQSIAFTPPRLQDIAKAVLLQRDARMVGMLWVIWVYLVCAMFIPLIHRMTWNRKNIAVVAVIFVLYELLCTFTDLSENRLAYITVFTIVPWCTLTYFAYYYDRISLKKRIGIAIVCAVLYIVSAIVLAIQNGHYVLTSVYKYPAQLYYLCFAVPIIVLLMESLRRIRLPEWKLLSFISSSSLWIYLWHMLFLYVVKNIVDDQYWPVQYVCILILAATVTFLQNVLVKKLMAKFHWNFLKVFLG